MTCGVRCMCTLDVCIKSTYRSTNLSRKGEVGGVRCGMYSS